MRFRGLFIIRNYFHVNLNSYTAWLGPIDSQYRAYLLTPEPHPRPHPLSVGNPPPPQGLVKCGKKIVISPAECIPCLPGRMGGGWSSDTQNVYFELENLQ